MYNKAYSTALDNNFLNINLVNKILFNEFIFGRWNTL